MTKATLLIIAILSLQFCNSSQAQDAQSQGLNRQHQVPGGGGGSQRPVGNNQVPDGGGWTRSQCIDILSTINNLEHNRTFENMQQLGLHKQTFYQENCHKYGFVGW
jgi:hypothetical protein